MIEHRFRQSWANTFLDCPEAARTQMNGTAIDKTNSSMVRGTVVHEAIEKALLARMAGTEFSLEDILSSYEEAWEEYVDEIDFWLEPEAKVQEMGALQTQVWFNEVFPDLNPVGVEKTFEFTLYQDEKRRINLHGTRDLDEENMTWDWKTGRAKNAWEVRRNNIQSMIYTLARAHEQQDFETPQPFTFCHLDKGKLQNIEVIRTPGDWDSLIPFFINIAELIEARLPTWPLRYDGWRCSDKWCGNFMNCRGKHIGESPTNW